MGSIEGRYVRNGEVTELFLPNGITEIQVDEYRPWELDVPEFARPQPKKSKKKGIAKEVCLVLSVILPFAFVMWKVVDQIHDNLPLALAYLLSNIWLMVFLFANTREEKE